MSSARIGLAGAPEAATLPAVTLPAMLVGEAVEAFRQPVALYAVPGDHGAHHIPVTAQRGSLPPEWRANLAAVLPGVHPETLGGTAFVEAHGCRFPYVVGEMARGIATARMTVEAARAGFLGFFGSAGLAPDEVAAAIREIRGTLGADAPWGANLIHAPDQPGRERAIADLFIAEGVARVSASAFMRLSADVVRLAASGLERAADGSVVRTRHVFAKVSRPEVARAFMSPPPADLLRELAAAGAIEPERAEWQSRLPVAEAVTVEADSGGHTDNRPLAALFPTLAALRDEIAGREDYPRPILLGAAGGIGTPGAAAAAFALGADYVVTGSVNQAAVESGLSAEGRAMLAAAGIADVAMAPAADMFERGVEVQVLKRGTFFAPRARRLHDIWRRNASYEALSPEDRDFVEKALGEPFADAWAAARAYLAAKDPALCDKGDRDPRQRMASVFRRHLFLASDWARRGEGSRRADYQIWCGPAMGAFNAWVAGSFLEPVEARTVAEIGLNILEGAARATRAQQLRTLGVRVEARHFAYAPRPLAGRRDARDRPAA